MEEKVRQLKQEHEIALKKLAMDEKAAWAQVAKLQKEQAKLVQEAHVERELAATTLAEEKAKAVVAEEDSRKKIDSIAKRLEKEQEEKEIVLQEREKVAMVEKERTALQAEKAIAERALEKVLVQCRGFEVALQKAKRNSTDHLQDRLASMIHELESAQSKYVRVRKERDKALESNHWLSGTLDRRTRQNELERQFLPLIRDTRGPLGNHHAKMSMTMSASEGALKSSAKSQMLR